MFILLKKKNLLLRTLRPPLTYHYYYSQWGGWAYGFQPGLHRTVRSASWVLGLRTASNPGANHPPEGGC